MCSSLSSLPVLVFGKRLASPEMPFVHSYSARYVIVVTLLQLW